MKHDSYLSPFTSYPSKRPDVVLFSHPFQRIYDNFYTLCAEDVEKFFKRALIVYKNFSDILFEHFKNDLPDQNTLELWTRQFIFLWNMSSTNFDSIYDYLNDMYQYKIGSGKYHVYIEGFALRVIDLETNKPVTEDYHVMLSEEEGIWDSINPPILDHLFAGLMTDVYNPYTNLIACFCFGDLEGCPEVISFEKILSELKWKCKIWAGS